MRSVEDTKMMSKAIQQMHRGQRPPWRGSCAIMTNEILDPCSLKRHSTPAASSLLSLEAALGPMTRLVGSILPAANSLPSLDVDGVGSLSLGRRTAGRL